MSVRELYERTLTERGYRADDAQLRAIAALERCENDWLAYLQRRRGKLAKMLNKPPIPRGVYMYGGVGRGKSFLMDCFFQSVPLKRRTRLHFHEFMREVHRELHELRGTPNPLDELGKRIACDLQPAVAARDLANVADPVTRALLAERSPAIVAHSSGSACSARISMPLRSRAAIERLTSDQFVSIAGYEGRSARA